MSTIDGGPAFPCEVKTGVVYLDTVTGRNEFEVTILPGMSLRDYFAAHCSEIDLQEAHEDMIDRSMIKGTAPTSESRAAARFYFADAMLKARAK